jgi:hypothetical protein
MYGFFGHAMPACSAAPSWSATAVFARRLVSAHIRITSTKAGTF